MCEVSIFDENTNDLNQVLKTTIVIKLLLEKSETLKKNRTVLKDRFEYLREGNVLVTAKADRIALRDRKADQRKMQKNNCKTIRLLSSIGKMNIS